MDFFSFLDEKIRTLGTAACPPYHLAVVIGGTSAELNMKTLKLALIIATLTISSTAFATGGKKEPPQQPTLIEEIIKIITIVVK